MKRMVLVVVVLAGSVLLALSHEAELALACSGPGPIENMLRSELIFEGRVASVIPSGPADSGYRVPNEVTFEVARSFKGVQAGQRVVANAKIPVSGKPIMCPQFPQDLAGKYVVIGLNPDEQRPGELLADAWVMPFIGAEPGGAAYEQAVRLAEMIADSNPVLPRLSLQPGIAVCGQPMHVSGRQFEEGAYLLRYSMSARTLAVVDVGPNGAFDFDTTVAPDNCRNHYANGQPMAIHALAAVAGPTTAWRDFDALVEIAFAPLSGAVDAAFPQLIVTPNPARCADELTIRGTGFVPGEQLNVGVGDGRGDIQVTADSTGAFEARHGIPPEVCKEPIIRVAATQAGFEAYTPPFLSIAEATLVRMGSPGAPPGPPGLGTGPLAMSDDGIRATEAVILLGLFFAAAAATATWAALALKKK